MLLNFKKQFVPWLLNHSKTHTIRAQRKYAPRVGEVCHCYTGLRFKGAKLLGRWPCVRVQDIVIVPASAQGDLVIRVDGVLLSRDESRALAWRDGFRELGTTQDKPGRSLDLMAEFWINTHFVAGITEFSGHMIHWDATRAGGTTE